MKPGISVPASEDSGFMVLPLATLALFAAFACWTLLAVVGIHLKQAWALSETGFAGLLILPLPACGLFALVMGALAERFGGRRLVMFGLAGMALVLSGILLTTDAAALVLAATGLGLAGGVFSAGLQYVATAAPKARRGQYLGIYLAGTVGAGFSYLVTPLVHSAYDWRLAPIGYIALILLSLLAMAMLTEPEPRACRTEAPRGPLPWDLCVSFGTLFGALLALTLWLPGYITAHYRLGSAEGALAALAFLVPATLAQVPGLSLTRADQPQHLQRPVTWGL